MTWFVFTFIMFLGTFKSSIALVSVFFFLWITFLLLGLGALAGSPSIHKIGGYVGLITAACAFYTGAAGVYTPETT